MQRNSNPGISDRETGKQPEPGGIFTVLKGERRAQNGSFTLPDFLIVGASKSATTWLTHCLMSHPDIFVHEKEIFYFDRYYSKGLKWYLEHFREATTESVIGENSNGYLTNPDAPVRIKKMIPDVKIIVCFRNPADRAYCDYCMRLSQGMVSDDIEAYLTPGKTQGADRFDFLGKGHYAKYLKRYLDHFSRFRIQVMIYDDLLENPRRYIETVCDFLQVDSGRIRFDPNRRINDRRAVHYPRWLARLFYLLETNRVITYRVLNKQLEIPAVRRLRDMIKKRTVRYPPLSDELRNRLVDHYTDSVTELEDLLGRDLGGWKKHGEFE